MPLTALTLTGLALTALAVPLNLYADRAGRRGLEGAGKAGASLGFLLCALGAPGALTSDAGRLTLGALALSALGDVLLLSRAERALLAGLGAFLGAHLLYAGAALAWSPAPISWGAGGGALLCALLCALLVGGAVVRRLSPRVPAPLRAPTWAYMCVISLMVAAAAGRAAQGGAQGAGAPLLAAGALMFWASDLSVALDRFVEARWGTRAWGIPLYYAAQVTFALALSLSPPALSSLAPSPLTP